MNSKQFPAEIKALEEDGTCKAYVATYRTTPDAQGDIIEPGAFTKSLSGNPRLPMLWQHDPKTPCGHWYSYKSDNHGILATGKFNLSTSWGRDAYGAVKGSDVDSFSIGFITEKSTYDRDGVRHLTELSLKEASAVTFAADGAAKLVGVKAAPHSSQISIQQVARRAAVTAIVQYQRENTPAALALKQIVTVAVRKGAAQHAATVATNQVRARRMAAYTASRYPR